MYKICIVNEMNGKSIYIDESRTLDLYRNYAATDA